MIPTIELHKVLKHWDSTPDICVPIDALRICGFDINMCVAVMVDRGFANATEDELLDIPVEGGVLVQGEEGCHLLIDGKIVMELTSCRGDCFVDIVGRGTFYVTWRKPYPEADVEWLVAVVSKPQLTIKVPDWWYEKAVAEDTEQVVEWAN